MFVIGYNEYRYLHISKKYFNPETVQSTMVEIDLQQLEDLQNNGETTMIYFGRPSCAHCSEIKPNLDILVNNSHSKVYYYNTEQDRDDNHDEMQPVLDTYGVAAVPALVVWAGAGETQEVYFNEDIVDYFLDTNKKGMPVMAPGKGVREGLLQLTGRPFRTVPYFDPGVWGGQWMKDVCGLDTNEKNFAWSFDGVP